MQSTSKLGRSAPPEAESFETALGTWLVAEGKLDEVGLKRARKLQASEGENLASLLAKLGLVTERVLAEAMAEQLGHPLVTTADLPGEPLLPGQLSIRFLKEARVLPLAETEAGLVVAVADPLNRYVFDAIRLISGREVLIRVAEPTLLESAIEGLYGAPGDEGQPGEGLTAAGEDSVELDVERLRDLASEAPVIRTVNSLITRAVEARASDVHIEPFENRLSVRYRIDGVLVDVEAPSVRHQAAIVSRVKIMARLNIAERRLPQDGRIKIVARGKTVDLRVSIVPTMHGESIVLRILDRDSVNLDYQGLGIDGHNYDVLCDVLARPHGIFLVTGPTGSGKTTTLYASLCRLNSPDKKILTVEDPVEYQLEGINQVQVKPEIGLSFAHVLRSFLRQDPDILMVGEIRDLETAEIAVQSALTEHLVLSTLHTNDAVSSVTRLLDMGIEDYLLTSTLIGVAAQRLVRTLCPDCKRAEAALPELAKQLRLGRYVGDGPLTLFRPQGCAQCNQTGFRGRMSLMESLILTDELRKVILRRGEAIELRRTALEGGMKTMFDDGMRKALAGLTTVEEVLRVTRDF